MKNRSKWLLVSVFICFAAGSAWAENERVTRPTSLGLELFGRGLLYTVQIDEVLSEELAAGIGFGTVGLQRPDGTDLNGSARLLPMYVNYYFMPEQGSVFATAGASLILNAGDAKGNESSIGGVKFSSAGVLPSIGIGYENRSPVGVLLRITGYGLIGKSFYPWFGFALGFAF